ncbi:hypothetical protein B296_00048716 [Ensete ventricosum]|uniref:Uncharacterized protein n=1 Tax=Ensete ventricosum TaxID=4639 RepID=A0A426XS57_ENSVE|nr:hypothetical protein B296_00048716 [Ensete ventricosum]
MRLLPLAREAAACATSVARGYLCVWPSVACEAVACAASAACDCLRVRSPPTRVRPNVCLGRQQRRKCC